MLGNVVFSLSLSPYCETHSMSLLYTIDPQAGDPTLTAGASGGHEEQEGALCPALSWGVHGSKGSKSGFGVLVSEHGIMPGPATWGKRAMGLQDPMPGMMSSPSPIPLQICRIAS